MAHDTTLAVEQGDDPAPPRVEVDGPRFGCGRPRYPHSGFPIRPAIGT